jgi:putative oxidoreductase
VSVRLKLFSINQSLLQTQVVEAHAALQQLSLHLLTFMASEYSRARPLTILHLAAVFVRPPPTREELTMTINAPLSPTPRRTLNAALWLAQGLLGLAFLATGFLKLSSSATQLATTLPWTADVPLLLVRFIGLAELLGALGLLLPALTRIRPALTPLAALGLLSVMVLAFVFHLTRGEAAMGVPSLVLGALAAFVAWGRRRVPILPRR